jgi:hypothetical protein
MKLKRILVLSLAINAVLLSAMGYIATQSCEPTPAPPLVRFITITNTTPAATESAGAPVAITETVAH